MVLLACGGAAAAEMTAAPNGGAAPVNQLAISGNACGPAALLAAFRTGSEKWQRPGQAVEGENDRQRLGFIIRKVAMRPSKNLPGRTRWSRSGVNVADLTDMANEMAAGHFLPPVGYEIFFMKPGETQEVLLRRVHARLEKSLSKGLPPVLSIRRYIRKKGEWTVAEAHFVTITALPRKLEKGGRSFRVSYLDPWGGRRCEGEIAISIKGFLAGDPAAAADPSLAPCLEAVFPEALVGKSKIGKGEPTLLAVSAAIGRF